MLRKFTAQEVIKMGAVLYDEHGFTRAQIKHWLELLFDNGCTDCDIDRVFDLIVG